MDKLVVVTGASGEIGAAIAQHLAHMGFPIIVHFNGSSASATSVAEHIKAAGGWAKALPADLTSEADIESLFHAVDDLGTLYGLVNNAGIITPIDSFDHYSAERIQQVFQVNVVAPMLCSREAVKRLSTSRGGRGGVIVNISSAAARLGSPNEFIDYAASKGALDTFTLGLAKEKACEGIRVNAVRPGLIDTVMHSHAGFPDRCQALAPHIPMGRAGSADEVAATVSWLMSEGASYVTGALVDVAGGR